MWQKTEKFSRAESSTLVVLCVTFCLWSSPSVQWSSAYGFTFCAIAGIRKQWLYSLSSFTILPWGFPLKIMLIVLHVSQSRHITFIPLKENISQKQSLSGDFQMYKHVFTVVPCLALTNFDYVCFMSFRGNQNEFICLYMFFKNYLWKAFTYKSFFLPPFPFIIV